MALNKKVQMGDRINRNNIAKDMNVISGFGINGLVGNTALQDDNVVPISSSTTTSSNETSNTKPKQTKQTKSKKGKKQHVKKDE